ncbi:MAG: hypothetical protein U1F20_03950 [Lysobacterales bacterium]
MAKAKVKVKEKFTRYDAADYLETEADIAAYLTACAEEDDPALLLAVLEMWPVRAT